MLSDFFFGYTGNRPQKVCTLSPKVNQYFYLRGSWKSATRVRPNIKINNVLHHDSVPCHTAIPIVMFSTSKNIPVIPRCPYSPNLSPRDFFLFPRLKNRKHSKGYNQPTEEYYSIWIPALEDWKRHLRCSVVSECNNIELLFYLNKNIRENQCHYTSYFQK